MNNQEPLIIRKSYFKRQLLVIFFQKKQMDYFQVSSNQPSHPYLAPEWCLQTCDETCQINFYYYGFIISAIFSTLTVSICLYNAIMHLINFHNPYFQAKIILIVLMPPAFCITSTLSFLSVRWSSYITLARDIYELVGLSAFFYLILAFLAFDHQNNKLDQKHVYLQMCSSTSQISHDTPCNYFQKPYQLSSWHKAQYFVKRCKRALLQFVIIKIVTSILLCLIYPDFELRIRDQSDWDYKIYNKLNTYIYWITTFSSYIAYYYMSMFYGAIHKKLMPYKPDLKFMTFNSTMYYTYWQKVWMVFFQNNLMACFDSSAPVYYSKKLMYCIENFLICIEMFFMSLAILQAYNYESYVIENKRKYGSPLYIIKDIFNIFRIELRLIKIKSFGFKSTADKNQTELITVDSMKNRNNYRMNAKIKEPIQNSIIQCYF